MATYADFAKPNPLERLSFYMAKNIGLVFYYINLAKLGQGGFWPILTGIPKFLRPPLPWPQSKTTTARFGMVCRLCAG